MRKLRFRIYELSVTVLFRITVELSYMRFRNSGIRIEVLVSYSRFQNSGFGFVLQVLYYRFRNTGLILEVSYSKFHIQRFRITCFVSRSFCIQRFRNPEVKVSDIGLLIHTFVSRRANLYLQNDPSLYCIHLIAQNMSIANQQTLAKSGAESRPPILEKGSYVPWASLFLRIKRLMQCTDISKQERHSRLMNEFDKFVAEDGESLTSVYESKYVTLTRQKFVLEKEHFDVLYDYLSQFEPHVKASKAKKAARNHDPLPLVANSHANFSYSHASPSYSRSPQPYYVTHPSSVIDYDDDYQEEIQGDAQEDKLSTAMIKNVGYAGNGNMNAGRTNQNQATNAGNGGVQKIEEYE
ncbi:hypothetical protein Tco_1233405 [Tanacetum coccineum]